MDQTSPFEDQLAALLPRLRRFAHALSRDAADADDLTQATVERALRSKAQWEPGTRLDSWCYRIMRNLWIDTARSRSRKNAREAPEEELAARIESYELAFRMQSHAAEVVETTKETAATKKLYGLDQKETAEFGLRAAPVSNRRTP